MDRNKIIVSTGTELHVFTIEKNNVRKLLVTVETYKLKRIESITLSHECQSFVCNRGKLFVTTGNAFYVHNIEGDVEQKLYENTSDKLTVYKCAVM